MLLYDPLIFLTGFSVCPGGVAGVKKGLKIFYRIVKVFLPQNDHYRISQAYIDAF